MKRYLEGKVVVVTGASSGIGEAMAREYTKMGAKVVMAARREEELQRIVADPASHLFVARINEKVVAMLTLGDYHSPTGRKAWVEDVVVDEAFRGRGLGREMVEFAIQYCKTHLAPCTLMLTSNPTRVAANELYRSSGFEQKITNVYKLNCPDNE